MSKAKMQRSTIEFSSGAVTALNYLKRRLGKRSTAEVIRQAVQVLYYLEQRREEGYTVGVVMHKEDGSGIKNVREVELIA